MATCPCYTFHSSFSYLYYHILSCYMLSSCTFHILHIHLYVFILSYTLCFRILSVLFLCWLKANTFISYLYFSYYVNFYLIFHISRRSIKLILLLSYHILSYVFTYAFMCFHILYFSCTFIFYLLSVLYLFISFSCTILCTFHILYLCTVHILFSYIYIHVLFISYTVFLLYFSYVFVYYAFHILYLYFTSCSCNGLYFHRIARLCFSYHIISYTLHLHFLCVYFSFSFIFMPTNNLEVDSGNNWVYPKVLSLYETVISVYVYPKVLSPYETVISV